MCLRFPHCRANLHLRLKNSKELKDSEREPLRRIVSRKEVAPLSTWQIQPRNYSIKCNTIWCLHFPYVQTSFRNNNLCDIAKYKFHEVDMQLLADRVGWGTLCACAFRVSCILCRKRAADAKSHPAFGSGKHSEAVNTNWGERRRRQTWGSGYSGEGNGLKVGPGN